MKRFKIAIKRNNITWRSPHDGAAPRRCKVKLFENTTSFLLVVGAQALAIGVILAI
jgi:hypothetical protein